MDWLVRVTKERSGSRWRVSGVGTQITITSQPARPAKSVLAEKRPSATNPPSTSLETASI